MDDFKQGLKIVQWMFIIQFFTGIGLLAVAVGMTMTGKDTLIPAIVGASGGLTSVISLIYSSPMKLQKNRVDFSQWMIAYYHWINTLYSVNGYFAQKALKRETMTWEEIRAANDYLQALTDQTLKAMEMYCEYWEEPVFELEKKNSDIVHRIDPFPFRNIYLPFTATCPYAADHQRHRGPRHPSSGWSGTLREWYCFSRRSKTTWAGSSPPSSPRSPSSSPGGGSGTGDTCPRKYYAGVGVAWALIADRARLPVHRDAVQFTGVLLAAHLPVLCPDVFDPGRGRDVPEPERCGNKRRIITGKDHGPVFLRPRGSSPALLCCDVPDPGRDWFAHYPAGHGDGKEERERIASWYP